MTAELIAFPNKPPKPSERQVTIKFCSEDWDRLSRAAAPLGISLDDMAGRIIRAQLKRRGRG